MKIAYADPPYLGMAKFYKDLHPDAADYDKLSTHAKLVKRLGREFPDGWVMSLTSTTLRAILPLCPVDTRVGAWVKPFCSFKKHVNPAYAWEPVLFVGGRKRRSLRELTVRDWHACGITLRRGLVGAKPEGFCRWVFALMGMRKDDELVDLFPGSGAVSRAWERFRREKRFLS